ncbi:MAG TPA: hypothetical protein PKH72_12480 [Rhodoferax sp.]|nr:hypothetical protein [Rhodoferax sp.]HPW29494.1 hypothetical protein [Rhodoferax sp.]
MINQEKEAFSACDTEGPHQSAIALNFIATCAFVKRAMIRFASWLAVICRGIV